MAAYGDIKRGGLTLQEMGMIDISRPFLVKLKIHCSLCCCLKTRHGKWYPSMCYASELSKGHDHRLIGALHLGQWLTHEDTVELDWKER